MDSSNTNPYLYMLIFFFYYICQVVELDLNTVVPCCSGPKRPQDRIPVSDMKIDFETCLGAKVDTIENSNFNVFLTRINQIFLLPHLQQGFKGFQLPAERHSTVVPFQFNGNEYNLSHGSVVIAAITSCTNTSNPSVMLGAGEYISKD